MATAAVPAGTVAELSDREGWRLFDAEARANLSVSGAEFLRRWNAGEYENPDDDAAVMRVAMLLPLVRNNSSSNGGGLRARVKRALNLFR